MYNKIITLKQLRKTNTRSISFYNMVLQDDDHYWYCEVCKDGGDLLLCDTCPRSWHTDCAKIQGDIPDGDWSCAKCVSCACRHLPVILYDKLKFLLNVLD